MYLRTCFANDDTTPDSTQISTITTIQLLNSSFAQCVAESSIAPTLQNPAVARSPSPSYRNPVPYSCHPKESWAVPASPNSDQRARVIPNPDLPTPWPPLPMHLHRWP